MNKLRALLAVLLLAPLSAFAATATYLSAATNPSTTASATYTTNSFTPTSGSVQFGGCIVSGTAIEPPTITNSLGGTYTVLDSITRSTNDRLYAFVANQTSTASSQTVTVDVTGDNGTGGFCVVYEADMTRTGSGALKQAIAVSEDTAGPSSPTVTFGGSVTTTNITFGCVALGSNPATVTEPTNWTEGPDTGYDTPTTGMECAARNSGYTGTTMTWGSSESAYAAFGIELDVSSASTPVAYSAGPTVAATTNGYTCSGTLTGSGYGALVNYCVAYAPGHAGAPTCAQIKAGQDPAGNAAILSGSETWTTGVADNFTITATGKPPLLDVAQCASDGTNNTSVTESANQLRSARSGYALVTIASISATSICDLDSYFTPDCAVGDVLEYEDDTNESSDCNVAIDTAGDITLTPVALGDCDGRQSFEISYQDVSNSTDGLFTAPAVGNFSTDDTVYVNNTAPVCELDEGGDIYTLIEDEAMTSQDFDLFCSDDDSDALTYSVTSGSLPTGTSLVGSTGVWSGTPTTENEAGAAVTVQACDPAGDCDSLSFTIYVINTWSAPQCVGANTSGCSSLIVAAAPWRVNDIGLTITAQTCRSTVAPGTILTQTPASGGQLEAFEAIDITIAKDTTTMPDVTGLPVATAIATIEALCP